MRFYKDLMCIVFHGSTTIEGHLAHLEWYDRVRYDTMIWNRYSNFFLSQKYNQGDCEINTWIPDGAGEDS